MRACVRGLPCLRCIPLHLPSALRDAPPHILPMTRLTFFCNLARGRRSRQDVSSRKSRWPERKISARKSRCVAHAPSQPRDAAKTLHCPGAAMAAAAAPAAAGGPGGGAGSERTKRFPSRREPLQFDDRPWAGPKRCATDGCNSAVNANCSNDRLCVQVGCRAGRRAPLTLSVSAVTSLETSAQLAFTAVRRLNHIPAVAAGPPRGTCAPTCSANGCVRSRYLRLTEVFAARR